MSPRLKFLLAGSLILIVLELFFFRARAQTASDAGGPAKIFGEVRLATDSIEHGLTQTDHSMALQTGVGYKWPQFRLGLWGSNVKYPDSDDNLNLRLYLATKLTFTGNADLNIRYDFNRYFKAGNRNGAIVSLDLRLFDYHVLYEQNDKWEGLDTGSRWGFMKEWNIPWNLFLNVNAGYDMVQAKGYSNYFDLRTQVSYKTAEVTYTLGNSFNSGAGQFNGRGDLAFYLSLATQF